MFRIRRRVVRSTLGLTFGLSAVMLEACGGGDGNSGGVTPPPPPPTVSSVEVTPVSATVLAPATQQLTAIAKDASGNTLTRTFTWTSSAPSVASVSATGLVTGVSAGTASITASVDGRQGSASITVIQDPNGPVLSQTTVGPSGGAIGTPEIGLTIPSGALSTATTITLLRDTVHPIEFRDGVVTPNIGISGFPSDREVGVRLRIKYSGALGVGVPAIALTQPAIASTATGDSVILATTLTAATDSSGYLVATVPVRGRPQSGWSAPDLPVAMRPAERAGLVAADYDPQAFKEDMVATGILPVSRALSSKGNFEVWAVGGMSSPDAKVTTVARLAETGRDQLLSMGYSFAHRTRWPMQVYLTRGLSGNGAFYSTLPFPTDPNRSYTWFNPDLVGLPWFPGTVIHELFHFVQGGYLLGQPWSTVRPAKWLGEMASTWIAERHPDADKPFTGPTAYSWRDSLWSGLTGVMVANSGYGKAPLLKYLTMTAGDEKVKQIYADVKGGTDPVTAFLNALPADRETWFNNFMTTEFSGAIFPAWPKADALPTHSYNQWLPAGRAVWTTDKLATLGVEVEWLTRDTAKFGPTFQMPFVLDTPSMSRAMLSLFRKPTNTGTWQLLATGDTVEVPGTLLRSTDSLFVAITNVAAQAPYNTIYSFGYRTDLSIPPGDLHATRVSPVANGIRFSCTRAGDAVTFDPVANVEDVLASLSKLGTWQRTAQRGVAPILAEYAWKADPVYADSIAAAGLTIASTMTVGVNDTVRVDGRFGYALSSALRTGGAGTLTLHHGDHSVPISWWSLLVLLAVPPLVMRGGRGRAGARRLLPVAGAMALLTVTACATGLISITMDERIALTFTKERFTADPANPNAVLVELKNGTGTTTMANYRMEHWVYFTTAGKQDSARSVCTATGSATYGIDAALYNDKVTPPNVRASEERLRGLMKLR